MINKNDFQFCFDLFWNEKFHYFSPIVYVVDGRDPIIYVDKKASPEVLNSMNIAVKNLDKNLQNAILICDELRTEKLFAKFEINTKSKKTLLDLINDEKFGFAVKNFIAKKTDEFLNIIAESNLPLSINLSKDKDFCNAQIQTQKSILSTKLFFQKTEEGLDYTLFLNDNDQTFYPSEKKITIIQNQPGWIVYDKKLCQLQEINSNKLMPFLSKKTVSVKEKLIDQYFEKFVKDLVKKSDIEADGFDIIIKNLPLKFEIVSEYQFFKNRYQFDLWFDYDGFIFKNHQAKNQNVAIENSNGQISIIQHKRNFDLEQIYVDKLFSNFGLLQTETKFFDFENREVNEHKLSNLEFLVANKKRFNDLGFDIQKIEAGQKKINLNFGLVHFTSVENLDWLDINMSIIFGTHSINFIDIIENIRAENPFFELPDGTFFLIPNEWMSKYLSLARFAKISGNVLKISKANFAILEDLSDKKVVFENKKKICYTPSPLLKATLRPYQQQGVEWLLSHYNNGLGACLADDMGLGKTLQTLALLIAVQEQFSDIENDFKADLFAAVKSQKDFLRTLVIMPTSLIFNWHNETKKFAPHFRILQYAGKDRKLLAKKLDRYDVVFISYSTAAKDIDILKKHYFNYVILDESQYIKNKTSSVFKALNSLEAGNKISLSGTPIENSLSDLWSQMQFINPEILGSYAFFVQHFKNPIEKLHNEKALSELKKIVQPFILRRTKNEVLHDLPELTEQIIYCDMSENQQSWYEEEKSKARNELLDISAAQGNSLHVLNVLMRLRQLSNHPKLISGDSEIESGKFLEVTAFLETILKSGHKTLIFSSFTKHLQLYEKWCETNNVDFCKITGETKIKDREIEVNRFQNNENSLLFFISLKTGSVGLNLTKASYVLILDPWWNPFAEQQAIGRAHRIGQENKVHVVRFISKNTIEEKIINLQNRKKLLSENIIDISAIPVDLDNNLSFLLE